jgi:hypothetical protein
VIEYIRRVIQNFSFSSSHIDYEENHAMTDGHKRCEVYQKSMELFSGISQTVKILLIRFFDKVLVVSIFCFVL